MEAVMYRESTFVPPTMTVHADGWNSSCRQIASDAMGVSNLHR